MGSIYINPVDLETHRGLDGTESSENASICLPLQQIHPHAFFPSNVLDFSFPLLLCQMILSSAVIAVLYRLLKPYGQPLFVCQLLGGILIGPSLLGSISNATESIFPLRSVMMTEALASIGFMFYFFLVGLQIDPRIILKIDKNAWFIGVSTFVSPMILSTGFSIILMSFVNEEDVAKSLPIVARLESVLSFPMIAYFLVELKIINSQFGRVALSSSIAGTLCAVTVMVTSLLFLEPGNMKSKIVPVFANGIVIVFTLFLVHPAIMRMLRRNPDGEPLKQDYIILIFLAVLVTGSCGYAVGLQVPIGPLFLGLALPAGAPVGSTLVEKLELMISNVLMPLTFAEVGLLVDVFSIEIKQFFMILSIVIMSKITKFSGAYFSSLRCQMPKNDAISLGLVFTFQGLLELGLFKLIRQRKLIDKGTLSVMVISMMLLTSIITPIIKNLYDDSRRYAVYEKRTLLDSISTSELRILVCIHDQENVPLAINFIRALNPTKQSPIFVSMLHLIELVGHTNPLLIPHMQTNETNSHENTASEHIVNAFKHLEHSSCGNITVFPFTSISPAETMHNDVRSIAIEKGAYLIIVPFHTRFLANGTVETTKMAAKISNQYIFVDSPCSVAILVDRGILKTSRSSLESQCSYHVAVLFLGGADDREALALGVRMAGCPNITLTIIRLQNKNITTANAERNLDNEVVSMFRSNMAGNFRVTYKEELVVDGVGTVEVIRSMEGQYDLVIVGRHHDNNISPLVSGLTFWVEQKELGLIGDLLASADFMGNTTILVVQEQTNVKNESLNLKYREEIFSDQNPVEEEVEAEISLIQKII